MRHSLLWLVLFLVGCGGSTTPPPLTPEQKQEKAREEARKWWKRNSKYLVGDIGWQAEKLRKDTGDPEAYIKVVRENLVFQESATTPYYGELEVHRAWKGANGKQVLYQLYLEVIPVESEAYYAYDFRLIRHTGPDGRAEIVRNDPEWFSDLKEGTREYELKQEKKLAAEREKNTKNP